MRQKLKRVKKGVLLSFVCNSTVEASETDTNSSQTVQKLPLTKKIHGVKRWGPWHSSASTDL